MLAIIVDIIKIIKPVIIKSFTGKCSELIELNIYFKKIILIS